MGFQAFSRNVEPNIELKKIGGSILNPAALLFGDNRAMEFAPPGIPRRLVGRDSNFERETSLRHSYAFQIGGLTRHKISDRERDRACHTAKAWMANTQNVRRSPARGSLHRLVRQCKA